MSGFEVERTLWTGAPPKGIRFVAADVFVVPFSFVWTGMAISFVVSAANGQGFASFDILSLFFVLIGGYFSVGRLLHDAYLRSHTRYTLTDKRLLIERDGLQPRRLTFDLRQLPMLDVREGRTGAGTIYFGVAPGLFSFSGNRASWVPELAPAPALRSIPNVRGVAEMIERASRTVAG